MQHGGNKELAKTERGQSPLAVRGRSVFMKKCALHPCASEISVSIRPANVEVGAVITNTNILAPVICVLLADYFVRAFTFGLLAKTLSCFGFAGMPCICVSSISEPAYSIFANTLTFSCPAPAGTSPPIIEVTIK